MKVIEGDLIKLAKDGHFDVIIHGCNCFNTMGGGIALQIKRNFKKAYLVDQETIKGLKSKLGEYTMAEVVTKPGAVLYVVNAYTQYNYGHGINCDYNAIKTVFTSLNNDLDGDLRIGIPKIGAGLAGGDWDVIQKIIEKAMPGRDLTLVVLK